MHGVRIHRGVDGHGGDAELLAGPQDAQRDLAAIGDEDFLKHRRGMPSRNLNLPTAGWGCRPVPEARALWRAACHSMTSSGSPYSTGWPFSTRILVTVPARGAGMAFMVFMASTIRIVWPSRTVEPTSTNAGAPGSGQR